MLRWLVRAQHESNVRFVPFEVDAVSWFDARQKALAKTNADGLTLDGEHLSITLVF